MYSFPPPSRVSLPPPQRLGLCHRTLAPLQLFVPAIKIVFPLRHLTLLLRYRLFCTCICPIRIPPTLPLPLPSLFSFCAPSCFLQICIIHFSNCENLISPYEVVIFGSYNGSRRTRTPPPRQDIHHDLIRILRCEMGYCGVKKC